MAYISKSRQPELAREGYNPNPSELAVEVISDEENLEEERHLRRKLASYLAAGTVTWVVYPKAQFAEIYVPGRAVRIIAEDGTLDGGEILPGFTLPLKEISESVI